MAIVFTDWNTWTCETYGNHTQNGSLSGIALGVNPQACGYTIANYLGQWRIYSGDQSTPIATFTGLPYTYTDDNVTFTIDAADYLSDTYPFHEYFDLVVSQNIDGTYVVGEPSHLTPYQLDWSSPAAIANKPPRIYGEAIRQAYNERIRAAMMEDAILLTPIYENRPFSTTWLNRFGLIPIWLYANQNDNGGDWHNQSSIPTWTVADLLAEIGQSDEWASLVAWLYQQYAIINQLVWPKIYDLIWVLESYHKISKTPYSAGFAQAQINFLNADLNKHDEVHPISHKVTVNNPEQPDAEYVITRNSHKLLIPILPQKTASYTTYDYLFLSNKGAEYKNRDFIPGNYSENRRYAQMSNGSGTAGDICDINNIQAETLGDPYPALNTWGYQSYNSYRRTIIKYNVPGGFTFQGTTFPPAPIPL